MKFYFCKMKRYFLLVVFSVSSYSIKSQVDSVKTFNVWGDIHFFSFYETLRNTKPYTGFGVSSGILGLRKTLSKGNWLVTGTIMYDVSKTTRLTYADTVEILSYTEGSHYTAYLKMGEIKLAPLNEQWHFSVGQLLSDQYLTLQDKAWGRRYLMTTMQEYYRLGVPADFGMRFGYFFHNKKWYGSISILNGDGAFRQQDTNSTLFTSFMLSFQSQPIKKHRWIGKIYVDYQPIPLANEQRMAANVFLQYEFADYKFGADFAHIMQGKNFTAKPSAQLLSNYIMGKTFIPTVYFLLRNDLFIKYVGTKVETQYMVGLEWKPLQAFVLSLSFRRNTLNNQSFIYLHAGFKF